MSMQEILARIWHRKPKIDVPKTVSYYLGARVSWSMPVDLDWEKLDNEIARSNQSPVSDGKPRA